MKVFKFYSLKFQNLNFNPLKFKSIWFLLAHGVKIWNNFSIWYMIQNNSLYCLNTENYGSKKNNAFDKGTF